MLARPALLHRTQAKTPETGFRSPVLNVDPIATWVATATSMVRFKLARGSATGRIIEPAGSCNQLVWLRTHTRCLRIHNRAEGVARQAFFELYRFFLPLGTKAV